MFTLRICMVSQGYIKGKTCCSSHLFKFWSTSRVWKPTRKVYSQAINETVLRAYVYFPIDTSRIKIYYGHTKLMSMVKISIAEAAKKLKISKKTLIRWDESGRFPAIRTSAGEARFYDEEDIKNHALWFEIRRKHKAHNRTLTAIRKEADRFSSTVPLDPGVRVKLHKFEEMKNAYDALRDWEKISREILAEYSKLPVGFKPKVDID